MTPPASESFKRADLVFEGEVVRKTEIPIRGAYIFRVSKLLKGSPVSEITIAGTGYNCDAWFTTDVVYRVYADYVHGKLISNQCSGNKLGGPARAASMTAEERSESARNAVKDRWARVKKKKVNK